MDESEESQPLLSDFLYLLMLNMKFYTVCMTSDQVFPLCLSIYKKRHDSIINEYIMLTHEKTWADEYIEHWAI